MRKKRNPLNLKKIADESNPDWEHNYTENADHWGDPKKDKGKPNPRLKSFYNDPEEDQGNLIDTKSQENYYLASSDGLIKIAVTLEMSNDIFDKFSSQDKDVQLDIVLFKTAYSNLRSGDIVVTYSKGTNINTYRRRFGSIKNAYEHVEEAVGPILYIFKAAVTLPMVPTDNETLYEQQGNRPDQPGAYIKRRDLLQKEDPSELKEKEPHQGYDIPKGWREDTIKRPVGLFDSELSDPGLIASIKRSFKKIAKIAWNPVNLITAQEKIKKLIFSDTDKKIIEATTSIEDLQTLITRTAHKFAEEELDIPELDVEHLTKALEREGPPSKGRGKDYKYGVYFALMPIYPIITNPRVFDVAQPEDLKNLVVERIIASEILDENQKQNILKVVNGFNFDSRKSVIDFTKYITNLLLRAQGLEAEKRFFKQRQPLTDEELKKRTIEQRVPQRTFEPAQPTEEDEEDDTVVTSSNIHIKVHGNIENIADVHLGICELGLETCHGGYSTRDGYYITTGLNTPPLNSLRAFEIIKKVKNGKSSFFHDARIGVFAQMPEEQYEGIQGLFNEAMTQLDNPEELNQTLIGIKYALMSRGENLPQQFQDVIPLLEQAQTTPNPGELQTIMQDAYDTFGRGIESFKKGPEETQMQMPYMPPEIAEAPEAPQIQPGKKKEWVPPKTDVDIEKEERLRELKEQEGREKGRQPKGPREPEKREMERRIKAINDLMVQGFLPRQEMTEVMTTHPWTKELIDESQLKDVEIKPKKVEMPTTEISRPGEQLYPPAAPGERKERPPTGKRPQELTPEQLQNLKTRLSGPRAENLNLKKAQLVDQYGNPIQAQPAEEVSVEQSQQMVYNIQNQWSNSLFGKTYDTLIPEEKVQVDYLVRSRRVPPALQQKEPSGIGGMMQGITEMFRGAITPTQANLNLKKAQKTTIENINDAHKQADIDKDIPLEIIDEEPVKKEIHLEVTKVKYAVTEEKRSKLVQKFLSNIDKFLQENQDIPPEAVNDHISELIINTLKNERNKDVLIATGFTTDDVINSINKVIENLMINKDIIVDNFPIIQVIEDVLPPEPLKRVHEMPEITGEESRLINQYTSDEIWQIVQDETHPENEIAKSVITKGLVAKNLNLKKKS